MPDFGRLRGFSWSSHVLKQGEERIALVLAERKLNPEQACQESLGEQSGAEYRRARESRRAGHSRRRLRVGRFLFTVTCVFLLGFLLIASHTRVAALGYKVSNLREQLEELQAENEYLNLKVSRLLSPQRVEVAARKQGMTYQGELRVVTVDPEVVVAKARVQPEATRALVSLVEPNSGVNQAQAAVTSSPASLDGLSRLFFQWLTGVRTAEAGRTH